MMTSDIKSDNKNLLNGYFLLGKKIFTTEQMLLITFKKAFSRERGHLGTMGEPCSTSNGSPQICKYKNR